MTRARNLADIVSGNFAVPSGSLSNSFDGQYSSLTGTPAATTLTSLGISNFDQLTCDASGNLTTTSVSGSGASLTGIEAFPTNWTAALSGSDMVFSYSGTAKFKLTTAGAVIAINDVTAFGSV